MSLTRRPRRSPDARPHSVLLFSPNTSPLRKRLRRAIAAFTTAVLAAGLVAVGVAAPASAQMNQPSDWVTLPGEACVDVGYSTNDSASNPYVLPAVMPMGLPAGGTYSKVIVKAGNTGTRVVAENTVYAPIEVTGTTVKWIYRAVLAAGDTFVHNEKGSISHVIVCAVPAPVPVAKCIPDTAISYTYNPTDNSGIVTVGNPRGSTGVLCKPLYITATSWKYKQNAVWGQTLDVVNKVAITTPGTYPYSAAVSCGQGDIYVSRTAFIEPTPELTGPQSWEKFLSGLGFATSTPGNTYMQQPTNCYGLVVPVAPAITMASACGVYGTVTPAVTDGVLYTTVFTKATGDYTVTATPTAAHHFAGWETSKVWSGNVGVYVDCVLKPTVTITTGECYADGGFSSKTVSAVFNNVGSNVAVTFSGAGVSETVPAGQSRTVQLSPVGNAGASLVFTAAGQTFTLAVPAFADCGAETNPSASVAVGACVYDENGTAGARSVEFTFDNSKSNRAVDFVVASLPQLSRTVAAGATVKVIADDVSVKGGNYTVTADGQTFMLPVPACPEPTKPEPVTTHRVVESAPDCSTGSVTITTTDTTTSWVFDGAKATWVRGPDIVTVATSTRDLTEGEAAHCLTIPTDPTSHDQVCLSNDESATLVSGYISVVVAAGVKYSIHNMADVDATNDIVATTADTSLEPGTYRVTAEALPGYTLAPFEPFPLYTIASAGACEQLPSHALADGSATGTNQSCSANTLKSGYITVALDQGLSYFIDGVELTSAVTNEKPGTYVVTGVAQEGFQWDGDPWTIVIAAAGSSCLTVVTELKTLAFTGFTGGAGYVGLAGLMLLLGAALIYWSRRRNARS